MYVTWVGILKATNFKTIEIFLAKMKFPIGYGVLRSNNFILNWKKIFALKISSK